MRRGFSLIETLLAATVASIMFTLMAVGLQYLLRAEAATQAEANTLAVLHHFAQRVRDDVHAAESFSLAESKDAQPTLTLTLTKRRTIIYDYHPHPAKIRRRVIEEGRTVARDLFELPRGSRIHWEPPPNAGPQLLAIVIERPVGEEPVELRKTRKTRIAAVLGLDRRYEGK